MFLRFVGLLVGVVCLTWVAVLAYWRTHAIDPPFDALVIYLGLLPLAVFGVVAGLTWAWKKVRLQQAQQAVQQQQQEEHKSQASTRRAATAKQSLLASEAAQRRMPIYVVQAAIRSVAGLLAEDLAGSVAQDSELRPKPDAELLDEHALPVVAARIDDVDMDAVQPELESLAQTVRATQPEWGHEEIQPHVQRSLAILLEPMLAVEETLSLLAQARQPVLDVQMAQYHRALLHSSSGKQALVLNVLVAVDESWSVFGRRLLESWLQARLQALKWPDHIRFQLHMAQAVHTPHDWWRQADELLVRAARDKSQELILLVTCHSDLDAVCIERLESENRLFMPQKQPKGVVPGEAAGLVLLAAEDAGAAIRADDEEPVVVMQRPVLLVRDKSIDAPGAVSHTVLQKAVQDALEAGALKPADITMLVSDADQHTSRSTELFGATLSELRHLDPVENMIQFGQVTGHTGLTAPILGLAVACAQIRSGSQPVLWVSVQHQHFRIASVVRQIVPPPAYDMGN